MAATLYMDYEAGSNAADATSYANRVKTLDSSGLTSARVAAGDTCRIMASLDATSLGNALWTNNSKTVTLSTSNITKMVFDCASAFTDATGGSMTVTTSATRKEGTLASSILPAGGFTTGLMVYKALAGATDFSAYQQLCCWIRSSATIVANTLRIDLCSDTAGATPVDSFTINFAINPVNTWHAVVINKGSALGSSIQSVAIVALLDPGTPTILIDDIFCSKSTTSADCLTLHSVLRKNGGVHKNYGWYGVQSVNGTTVSLETLPQSLATATLAYPGDTETVATDARQCIPLTPVTAAGTIISQIQRFGTSRTVRNAYSFGWNRTDMTTQTGETFFTTINGLGIFLDETQTNAFIDIEKVSIFRIAQGFYCAVSATLSVTHTDCNVINATTGGFIGFWTFSKFTRCGGFSVGGSNGTFTGFTNLAVGWILDTCYAYCAVGQGFDSSLYYTYTRCEARACSTTGFVWSENTTCESDGASPRLIECYGSMNTTTDITCGKPTFAMVGTNCLFESSTIGTSVYGYVRLHNDDQIAGNHTITATDYLLTCQTATVHTAGGKAWKLKPSSTNCDSLFPINFLVGAVKVTANVPKVVRLWFRRGHATDCSAQLVCPGSMITGISSDITTSMSAAADTWEQLSITITGHTVTDTVPIYARVWTPTGTIGATVYAIVDDMSWSN